MPKKQDSRKPKDEKIRAMKSTKPKLTKSTKAKAAAAPATALSTVSSSPVAPDPVPLGKIISGGVAKTAKATSGPKTKAAAAVAKPKARLKKTHGETSGTGARKGKGRSKSTVLAEEVAAPIVKRAAATSTKIKKAVKSAKRTPVRLVSDLNLPSLPTRVPHNSALSLPHLPGLPHVDVAETARSIGSQIMSVLNTSAGRLIAAEVLMYLATSLTKAANTEAGRDATQAVLNAGAKMGAVVANAGAKAIESGGQAAEAGVEQVSEATTAKDIVREVAQVAVSTVGSVMVDAANKVIRGRGRRRRAEPLGSDPAISASPMRPAPRIAASEPDPSPAAGS